MAHNWLIDRARRILAGVARRVRPPHPPAVRAWFADDGDNTLRLDYDLGQDSLVFDLGGYRGDWAAAIDERYGCRVLVFEPVPDFADAIEQRFAGTQSISVHRFAMADRDGTVDIGLAQDASSMLVSSDETVSVPLRRAADVVGELGIDRIDLMKINIEGAEYDLLDHLIEEGVTDVVTDLQVQFHDFVPNAVERRRSIQRRLDATHDMTYCYPFVWENWHRRQPVQIP